MKKPTWSVCELFSRALPQFLAIGMPYELFYDGRADLTVSYRRAHRIRREQANFDAYLQGAYVYDAILRASPILHAFAKAGTKPKEWLDKPYELSLSSDRDGNIRNDEGKKGAAGKAFMEAFMVAHNSKMKSRKASEDKAVEIIQ